MIKFYCDLDGVLRDLTGNFLKNDPQEWHWTRNGKDIYDFVNNNLEILATSKPEKYHKLIASLPQVNILTCQPREWRIHTLEWIQNNLGNYVSIEFINHPDEKLAILERDNAFLFDDYPMFKDYSRIYVVDHAYNRHIENCKGRIKTVEDMRKTLIAGGQQ